MTKKLYIETVGCQMNVLDSELVIGQLRSTGFSVTDDPARADVVLLNTCSVRQHAEDKVLSRLGALKKPKLHNPDMVIGVIGCMAERDPDGLVAKMPHVDLICGPGELNKVPALIAEIRETRSRAIALSHDMSRRSTPLARALEHDSVEALDRSRFHALDDHMLQAYVRVQRGCDKFCTFCVVPYTRGAEYSRPAAAVLAEAASLARDGVLEITFLGQNVNTYRGKADNGDDWGLARLIGEAAKIDGIERIRYTTSYPAEVDDDLIAAHGSVEKLMPFIHLPVQSGSAKILKAMNRRHDADDYRRLVEKLRAARSDIALSSDFIVGFPGETDDDFKATLSLVEEIGFAHSYSFKYSPRPGTPAAALDGQVEDALKSARLAELQALLDRQQLAFNLACQGRVMAVLFERRGRRPGQLVGRSPYMQPVHASLTDDFLGTITEMRITDGFANSLHGVARKNTPETERLTA